MGVTTVVVTWSRALHWFLPTFVVLFLLSINAELEEGGREGGEGLWPLMFLQSLNLGSCVWGGVSQQGRQEKECTLHGGGGRCPFIARLVQHGGRVCFSIKEYRLRVGLKIQP